MDSYIVKMETAASAGRTQLAARHRQANTEGNLFQNDHITMAEAELRQEQQALSQSVLGRRLIYFHHIIAGGKRQAIQEWAVQLRLGGYAKIGWSAKDFSEPPASMLALRALQER